MINPIPSLSPQPKKSLGQHFLVNPHLSKKIVQLLNPLPQDRIIEIGPGPGALTRQLLEYAWNELIVIEKDDWWAQERANTSQIKVLNQDIMNFNWQSISAGSPWKLIGNLPYNIASPLIWNIMNQCNNWQKAVFMVQKEVAQRICSQPGSRIYGGLSVWVQCHAISKINFILPPGAFNPPPKIDSAVITLIPLSHKPLFPKILANIIHLAFQQRRKQIGTIFKNKPAYITALENCAIDLKKRPEQLTRKEFLTISQYLGHTSSIDITS